MELRSGPSPTRRPRISAGFRLEHALNAIENALILLDTKPAEAIELAALERVRDDLAILLRAAAVAA